MASGPKQSNSGLQAWATKHPKLFRVVLNLYPPFRGTGAWCTFIADDWSEMRIKIPLSLRTRNYVGTIFGGSLYAGMDPHFMFMLMHRLGPDYLVWDKAASIRFRKPGRAALTAVCRMPDEEVAEVKQILETQDKVDRNYSVDLVGKDGTVHATVDKVVNVRRRRPTTA
ncbi:MAG: hypothetical protein QOC71_1051 [Thermoplasmata archaeon]|nr:hypothetical protein [Thermoplasmata archaeon]